MKYNDRLRKLRQEKGLYQRDIAQLLNTSQNQYSRYENGTEMPYGALTILAKFYDTTTDYILGVTNIKEKPKK